MSANERRAWEVLFQAGAWLVRHYAKRVELKTWLWVLSLGVSLLVTTCSGMFAVVKAVIPERDRGVVRVVQPHDAYTPGP